MNSVTADGVASVTEKSVTALPPAAQAYDDSVNLKREGC